MNKPEKRIIIWDWNGTLLDDVHICIDSMNGLLQKRKLPLLSIQRYKQVFTFPVKDYYQEVGFDFSKESFDDVAVEFIDAYREQVKSAQTFSPVQSLLQAFNDMGYKQYLISAMEHEFLKETLIENEVVNFLEAFSGIQDHYANGKLEMAKRFFKEKEIDSTLVDFIGDTIHDFEVAEGLGVRSILVANGHQSYERLEKTGTTVVENLFELMEYFNLNNKN